MRSILPTSPIKASYRGCFGVQSVPLKSLQAQAFASVADRDENQQTLHNNSAKSKKQNTEELIEENMALASVADRDENQQTLHNNSAKSKKQNIEELIEENMALKKTIETLQAEAKKKPNNILSTFQKYGLPFLFWWVTLYSASGVTIYVVLDTGLVSGARLIDFIMQLGLDKIIDPARLDPTYSNVAIAIIANECLEMIRFPIALATLPYVKRVFSRKAVESTK
ncbi:Domain of unknown function DUF1279 [Plasmopara halstedii]|uniref:DUF1279 domain-containing protein n=1 Tax=Plasmopara halstedii TaxID=4781 RepID=A0A0P1AIS6_PLAHL|nr:Domain of unknown function DUF1279 [Plasmopara halstedii]CEG40924.1 Domain of unknown function DUF1279 [Plasmopara halstedii]|eukprot:XP_024577293.1 Domain of unknown function DUF1279 [Plasmopara halstedii]